MTKTARRKLHRKIEQSDEGGSGVVGLPLPAPPRGRHTTSWPQQEGGHVGGRPPSCAGSRDPSPGQLARLHHTRTQHEDATSHKTLQEDTSKAKPAEPRPLNQPRASKFWVRWTKNLGNVSASVLQACKGRERCPGQQTQGQDGEAGLPGPVGNAAWRPPPRRGAGSGEGAGHVDHPPAASPAAGLRRPH